MRCPLSAFNIFLHGPSGAGKGEFCSQLSHECARRKYALTYISSGQLFREIHSDRELARRLGQGHFAATLEPVLPLLKLHYCDFLREFVGSSGRALVLMDGVIRRGRQWTPSGNVIPSQLEQVATSVTCAISQVASSGNVEADILRLGIAGREQHELVQRVANCLATSTQVLIDVFPCDAEAQIRERALKELVRVHSEVSGGNGIVGELRVEIGRVLDGVIQVLARGTGGLETDLEIERLRTELARLVSGDVEASWSALLGKAGVRSSVRDEDLSSSGRWRRVSNYLKVDRESGKEYLTPGFAAEVLTEDLGFEVASDGTFRSRVQNAIVISNGRCKGTGLAAYQAECRRVAALIIEEAEQARARLFDPSHVEWAPAI